jgi:carboxyl-terminal processing protease
LKITLRITFLALPYLILLVFSGCSGGSDIGPAMDPRVGFTYPDPADYSTLTWTDAFMAAHKKFSQEYAFSDWKGVDWPGLYSRFLPRVTEAQAANDGKAYYLALHEYICSIPDRHISLSATNSSIPSILGEELAGGGFGMAVAELNDLRVIVAAVSPNGPANMTGIAVGAEIITWGGQPIKTAIGKIDVRTVPFMALSHQLGQEKPIATQEYYRLEQARLLARGPVGTTVQTVFRNPGSTSTQTATLTAVDDGGLTFSLLNFAKQADFSEESDQVDYRILPEGYGYVVVKMEKDILNPGYPTRVFQKFQEAITSFVKAVVPGVIVDLRGNFGGSDDLSADLCGFFYNSPSFYEYQEYYDKRSGQFVRITIGDYGVVDHISIKPQIPHYSGPVVALVNPATHSSGEGPPMGIARLPQGSVIGFHGTGGSFGMVGGKVSLPGGYAIEYPNGRSTDQYGVVQLDSRNGIGGVAPNPRVPKTLENVLAFAAGTDVELQYAIRYLRGF